MHKVLRSLLFTALLFGSSVPSWATFAHFTKVTVDHTKLSGNLTNYTVLLWPTDDRFKTTGNGGHVTSSSGFDIRPHANSSCSSALTYEIVDGSYVASTGEFQMWVLLSSVSASAPDTSFYLCYGDSGVTTDGGSTATWTTLGFIFVGHLQTDHANGYVDSWRNLVPNTANQTIGAAGNAALTTGKVGKGSTLDGSGDYIAQSNTPFVGFGTRAFSWMAWFKTNTSGLQPLMGSRTGCTNNTFISSDINGSHHAEFEWEESGGGNYQTKAGTTTVDDNNWHRLVVTRSGVTGKIYIDNNLENTNTGSGTTNLGDPSGNFGFGRLGSNNPFNCYGVDYTGLDDEVWYIDGTAVSADWVAADYNNTNAPASFTTLGPEDSIGAGGSRGFIIAFLEKYFPWLGIPTWSRAFSV